MNLYSKLIPALRLATETLEDARRRRYTAGDAAYRQGIRSSVIDDGEVTGTAFGWVEHDHKDYERYTAAIEQIQDWIEVLQDPGVTYEENADLPLFALTVE